MREDLIIYGGSFNPPTIAHKAIINYLANTYPDKTLMIMPTNNLFKKSTRVSFEARCEMIKLILKELGLECKANIYISDYEADPQDFKGTVYTLRAFNHPYFVIGADVMADIVYWPESEELIRENYFIVMPRKNYDFDVIKQNSLIRKYLDHFIIVNDTHIVGISSSEYRRTKDESLLSEAIVKYIKENHLYEN